jgi:uncharacterized protein (DUF433 family)
MPKAQGNDHRPLDERDEPESLLTYGRSPKPTLARSAAPVGQVRRLPTRRGDASAPTVARSTPCARIGIEDIVPGTCDRITHDPNVLAGRATIRGLRISVVHVVNLVANGVTPAQVVQELPDLEVEDIGQALAYAAALAQDELLDRTRRLVRSGPQQRLRRAASP